MDAETKGIVPGELVDFWIEGSVIDALYIGKIPEVRVHDEDGDDISTDSMNIMHKSPCDGCDYKSQETCTRGCIWGGLKGKEFCHYDFDLEGLKQGDFIPDYCESDNTAEIKSIKMLDAVYVDNSILYVNSKPFGTNQTMRKKTSISDTIPIRKFQDCGNLYPYIQALYHKIMKSTDDIQSIFTAIKSGDLTSKIKTIDGNPHVAYWEEYGYGNLVRNIYTIMDKTQKISRREICVYRAIGIQLEGEGSLDITNGKLTIPLPASSTINLKFVQSWYKKRGTTCCLLKIHLKKGTPYVPVEPQIGNSDTDQDEVLIPAGELHISDIYLSDLPVADSVQRVRIIEGWLEPWNLSEVKDYARLYHY